MFKISHFFKKVQGGFAKELAFRTVVQGALKKHVSIDVPVEAISLKSSVIYLKNISQEAKSAIFIKKQGIVSEINNLQKIYIVKDIR